MKNDWKGFFYFTKTERNGLFILSVLCLLLLSLPNFFSWISPPASAIDFSSFEKEVNLLLVHEKTKTIAKKTIPKTNIPITPFNPNNISKEELLQFGLTEKVVNNLLNYRSKGGRFFKKEDLQKIYGLHPDTYQNLAPYIVLNNTPQPNKEKKTTKESPLLVDHPIIERHPFDPNTATEEELLKLGIATKPVRTILNFRSKGGSFRKKEDFQKIFGISEEDYQTLEPYIHIQNSAPKETPTAAKISTISEKTITSLDINQSTPEDWQKIKGIGPSYAKRIVAWREKLGGFSQLQQVGETYGLPDSVFQKIRPILQVSPILKTISINSILVEDLQKHPYFNFKQAKAISNYRINHGPFKNWSDLQKVRALSAETLEKIKPYIDFN